MQELFVRDVQAERWGDAGRVQIRLALVMHRPFDLSFFRPYWSTV